MGIKIADKTVGAGFPVFIVAEISANHGQDISLALELIKRARACGADAVKFQAYTADTMTIDADNKYFRLTHPQWGGQSLYELYQKAATPWEWFADLKQAAEREGLVFFATAFDRSAVDFLEGLSVSLYKIASFELADTELISYAAGKNKPLILSCGMADAEEIQEAVSAAKKADGIVLLKCVSSYPAAHEEMNLRTIPDMSERFNLPVGISDHTLSLSAAVSSVALGAVMVEKHFTLSRKLNTLDSFFSLEPAEFRLMVDTVRESEASLGKVCYGLTEKEKQNRIFKRSLFAVKDIKKGEIFSSENIRSIRPGYGMAPKWINQVLGKKAVVDISRGTPLEWEYVDKENT